jgi:hypothetical protein
MRLFVEVEGFRRRARLGRVRQLLALCAILSYVGWYRGGSTCLIDSGGPIHTHAIMLRWY